MSTVLQLRRGTGTENSTFTGANGELSVDTTNRTVRVHDGVTAGGSRLSTSAELATVAATIPSVSLLAPLASPALTGTPTAPTATAGTSNSLLATTAFAVAAVGVESTRALAVEAALAPVAGHLFGLTLSNDVSTPNTVLDVSAGSCADSTGTVKVTLGAFTKSISGAWAIGSGSNGMGTGLTVAANTWYHVFAILRSGAADVYFDTSPTAANAPTGTTAFRRIGSIATDTSGLILGFIQRGDRFSWGVPIIVVNGTPGVTTAQTVTVSGVPLGIVVETNLSGSIADATAGILYLSQLNQVDIPAGSGITARTIAPAGGTGVSSFTGVRLTTNTSGQIRSRNYATTTSNLILSDGWYDSRGK